MDVRAAIRSGLCLATLSCLGLFVAVPAHAESASFEYPSFEYPAEVPAEKPVESPAEVPAESPAEMPAESPAEMPVEPPVERSAEAPAEPPVDDGGTAVRDAGVDAAVHLASGGGCGCRIADEGNGLGGALSLLGTLACVVLVARRRRGKRRSA